MAKYASTPTKMRVPGTATAELPLRAAELQRQSPRTLHTRAAHRAYSSKFMARKNDCVGTAVLRRTKSANFCPFCGGGADMSRTRSGVTLSMAACTGLKPAD